MKTLLLSEMRKRPS